MGIPNASEKTLVFKVADESCMCDGCVDKVRKKMKQIHGKVSIDYNEGERKLTIQGCNLDSKMVITELGDIKKKVDLVTQENSISDQIEDNPLNQIELSEMEILNDEASTIVLNRSLSHKEVAGFSAVSNASHLDHEHELELKNFEKRFTCDGCKEGGFRTRYRCKHCDYELHEDCMNPKPTVSHELFQESVFKFSHGKPICSIFCRVHTKSCEACGNEIHGYSYHCEDKNLYLHPMCVNLRGKLCIQGETFILKNKATPKCFWCNGSENKTTSGWSYVSEGDKGQLHVNCMAKMAHEAWKGKAIEGSDDAYIMVLNERLNWGIVKNRKKNGWSKGGKLLKMIMVFARTVLGILLGDPTVIVASTLVEIFKK